MSTLISGQIAVTTAGTAVSFTTLTGMDGTFLIGLMPTNSGSYCYIGNDGADDVTSANGAMLKKDTHSVVITVNDLRNMYLDSDTDGDGVWWLKVMGSVMMTAPPSV